MGADKASIMLHTCFKSWREGAMLPCVTAFSDVTGWFCTAGVFGYAWLTFLFLLHSAVVRLCCGQLRGFEAGTASRWLSWHVWKTLVFANVVLAPQDLREWGFWYVWFSAAGLLRLWSNIGKQHFEHQVVDNPRFGPLHTLRALSLHAFVLYAGVQLALLGWSEFYYWGEGTYGQVLLSPLESLSTESTKNVVDMRNPARGGLGFTLMLLFDVAITAADVCLSALKYLINLLEMHRGPLNTSGNVEAGLIEQTNFFVTFIIAILTGARTVHLFRACGHCCLLRKLATRLLAIVNGGFAMEQIYRAARKVVLAREIDIAFPDASQQELQSMARDESCAICLKTMNSAKRLKCQHFFHGSCLQQYLTNAAEVTPLCPICRARILWQPPSGLARKRSGGTTVRVERAPGDTGQFAPDPDLPGIITGNAPRPDSFTRAARGAYGAARMVHNVARAWRNDFDMVRAAAVAAAREEQAARTRSAAAAARMATVEVPLATAAASSPAGADSSPDHTTWAAVPHGPTAMVNGSTSTGGGGDTGRQGEGSSSRQTQTGEGDGGTMAGGSAGNSDEGPESTGGVPAGVDAAGVEAAAQQLLEIFPEFDWTSALGRAREAGGSVQRAVEQYFSGGGGGRGVGGVSDGANATATAGEAVAASAAGGGHGELSSRERELRHRRR